MKPTTEQVQERRYSFKAEVEAEGLSLSELDPEWSEFDFPQGFIFAEDHACWCMPMHHYHSVKDGGLLQVG